ncbi:hypothetical protein [Amycolatopsis minnesotensis]
MVGVELGEFACGGGLLDADAPHVGFGFVLVEVWISHGLEEAVFFLVELG